MGFRKTIDAEIKRNVSGQQLRRKIRQANHSPLAATIGDDDFVMKNGYLYTVVRAISARVNQNYDGWPSDELKLAYKSFVGKPVFVNHQNSDPTKARGRVVAARYFENGADKGIECIMEVDAQRFPKLAHEIRSGGLDSVSMGAEAGHTICSMCGNKATDTHDMCDHVKFHKGEHLIKAGKREPQLVYETCHKLGFFELSYVFDPADETAVVSKVIQAARTPRKVASWRVGHRELEKRGDARSIEAMIHQAYGETQAPESVDTLRQEEEGSEEDFHSYVETPKELRDPNLDRTQQLDREQQAEGLDGDRNVENVESWEAPDHAANEMPVDPRFAALLRQADVAAYDPWSQNGSFNTGLGQGPQPQQLEMAPGITNMGGGGGQKMAPGGAHPSGGGHAEGPTAPAGGMSNGMGNFADDPLGQAPPIGGQVGQGGSYGPNVFGPGGSGGPLALPSPSVTGDAPRQFNPDAPATTSPTVTQASFERELFAAMGVTPVNGSSSPLNERRAREDHTMARRSSLASRKATAAKGRQASDNGQTDGGDQSVNSQSTREPDEAEFIVQTPSPEAVELGDAQGGISNTESNLVARLQANQRQILVDAARLQQLQAQKTGGRKMSAARQQRIAYKIQWLQQKMGRRLTADETSAVVTSVPETADTVNPALSGTDDQSLKGSDFQPADPNAGVQTTQPKDASVRAFQAFDQAFTQATGHRVAAVAAKDPRYVIEQAKRFASYHKFNPQLLNPTLGRILQASTQRRAVDLDVAAPGGRVDVEAPTSNTTDAEAQASQFPIGDFGNNAGDNLADPDLSTDSVTWAPGEGKKEGGVKRASTASAVRCADLFVEAGLREPAERYNLIAAHEGMRAGQVADRIAMLELFKAVRQADAQRAASAQRRVASGVSRGAKPAGIPQGFGSGSMRTAGTQRVSALEDQSTDGLMFIS